MLFLDGVYVISSDADTAPVFRRVPGPSSAQLQHLLGRISQHIGRYLERQGLLVRAPEHAYLQLDASDVHRRAARLARELEPNPAIWFRGSHQVLA